MPSNSQRLIVLAALILTLWTVLATSILKDSLRFSSVYVQSDCVEPFAEAQLSINDYEIVEPVGLDFTDFGLPQPELSDAEVISGTFNGVERSCRKTLDDTDIGAWLYTCWDDGAFACNVYFNSL